MVKITNGVNVFEVTHGAFKCIYSKQGYHIVEHDTLVVEDAFEERQKTEDDIFAEALVEKPISQWNKEEVKKFAAIKGIDIKGTENVRQAKEIIKAYLEDMD